MNQKVLVIDDDPDIQEAIRLVLEKEGLEVLTAENGAKGLELAAKEKPDLIFLDVMMTTQDEGFQTAYRLRAGTDLADVPIIMVTSVSKVTGFAFDKEKDQDFLPVSEFIEKPISPKQLKDIVRKYLGK